MNTMNFNGMANEELVRTIAGTPVHTDNTLRELSNMSIEQLTSIKGVGEKTAKKLLAAFELGRRLLAETMSRTAIYSTEDLYNHLRPMMQGIDNEVAYLVVMNQQQRVLKTVELSKGGLTETAVDVRIALKHALLCNGTVIALAHNHPSGDPKPSRNDDTLTKQFSEACKVMRIFFMDHIIIGDDYYSYHDHGRL